jgi:SNF2 family DNA or RNA helicase
MTLYKHQQDAVQFAIDRCGKAALFHDPGLGKTLSTLEIFKHYRQQDPNLRLLVVCPLSLINAAWGEDVKKFTDYAYIPYADLHTTDRPDIIGINFESLIVEKRFKEVQLMLANCSPLHPKLIGSWMICVDESSRMKNHKSMTTKALLRLAPYAKYRIVASGTPAPNSELEFWAQAKFIRNDSFPDSFFQFRNRYFHLGRGNQVMAAVHGKVMSRSMMAEIFSHGWKYMITPENRERLMATLSPLCHWVRKEDALDLPEKVVEIRRINLNPNEKRAYKEMLRHLVTEIKQGYGKNAKIDQIAVQTALSRLQKLRQITSGFLYTEEHDAVRPGRSSKMRELKNTLEEVVGGRQCIIWINYREEVAAISDLLTELELKFVTLYSETEDKEASIKAFQDGSAQILLANSQSAGHGLTFVNCSLCIYFSLSYSWEQYAQSQDRVHRIGQKNNCLYIHLLADNTIDTGIMDVLNKKKSLQDLCYQIIQEQES